MARGHVRSLVAVLWIVAVGSCGDDGARPIDAAIHDAEVPDAVANPGTPVLRGGVFVGGAVDPGAGSVQLRGRFVWHGRIEGQAGGVKLSGWFE